MCRQSQEEEQMLRPRQLLLLGVIALLLVGSGLGQDRERIKFLAPNVKGSSGLFQLPVAETYRQGEFTLGLNSYQFYREPGRLAFTLYPLSVTVGLHDRVELWSSWEVHKRVHARYIMVNKILPTQPLEQARLRNGNLTAYNDAPFMDVGFGDAPGEIWLGAKFNVLSERRGAPLGLAFQPLARIHTTDDRAVLARGLSAGATDAGFELILSKNLPGGGVVTGTSGALFAQDKLGIDRQNRLTYGAGFAAPLGTLRAQLIAEVAGSTFFGDRSPGLNPVSPVDLDAGLRVFPANWMSLSGAYLLNLRTLDEAIWGVPPTGRHGWIVQLAFHRKVDRPPTVECSAERTTVTEGDSVTIRAEVFDEDDDVLTVTWRTTGGRITQQNNTAVLDTTGLTEGRYTVTAEVSDRRTTSTCAIDVNVEKRRLPPTVQCQPSTVTVTEGESVTLRAAASDPNNDPLTYSWTVNGEAVAADQPTFEFGTVGRRVGTHTVRVTVTDIDGMSASCEFTVTVERRPNRPPVVSLSLDQREVIAGGTVTATAQASDPDGDPITISWTVDNQARPETGSQITINTSGMAGGPHTVTVTVRDDRDGVASETASFSVRERITIQINRIRPDNVAKARLDEIALKMQQDPRLRAIITGYTDDRPTEAVAQRQGMQRAQAARDYLVQQHRIDTNRFETRSGGKADPVAEGRTEAARRQNRRIVVELFVP
jgi:outer membrane protein OmpA-like peptidoglycan-associated protein